MTFGFQCDEPASVAILDAAAEAGITFLDTADAYPLGAPLTDLGRTEEILGRWLKGRRDRFILATKCFAPTGPSPWDAGNSRQNIMRAIDASLRRLQTDHVDLYQLHFWDVNTPVDESLLALDDLVHAGKVRYVGISNVLAYRLARSLGRSEVLHVGPLRLAAAALQPALPAARAGAAAARGRGADRRHPVQRAGRWAADRQARRRPAARRGHALHARQRGPDLHRPLLARTGDGHRRGAATLGRRGRADDGRHGHRLGAGQPGHHEPDHRGQPTGPARRRGARRRVTARARPQGPPRRADDRVPLRRRAA